MPSSVSTAPPLHTFETVSVAKGPECTLVPDALWPGFNVVGLRPVDADTVTVWPLAQSSAGTTTVQVTE